MTLPTEDVAALVARLRDGLSGVTPGPWNRCGGATPKYTAIHAPGHGYVVFGMADATEDREHKSHGPFIKAPGMDEQHKNAAHIALCSPDNIRALLDHIAAQEAALSTLAGERDEARATPLQARLDAVEGQEPVYKAIERILDEHSAWISRPNREVTKAIALAATIAAHEIAKGMAAIDAVELQVQADEVARLKADKPQTWQGLDDARLQLAINAFYEPCEGTTIDGVRAAILAWEQIEKDVFLGSSREKALIARAEAAEARATTAEAQVVAMREAQTGWLVELKGNTPSWAILFSGDYDDHWTTDSTKALRFSRKIDAEAFIAWHGWTETFASEHIWDDARTALLAGTPPSGAETQESAREALSRQEGAR